MKAWLLPLVPLLLAGCDLDVNDVGPCNERRDFNRIVDVGSALETRIVSDNGFVRVVGRSNIDEVRVVGRACARNRRDLDDVEMVAQRMDGYVRVLGLVARGGRDARIDLTVEVPDWMLVEIEALRGDVDVDRVSGLIVINEWGDIDVSDVFGDVEIEDGSGHIDVRHVDGDVWIWDESGDIYVEDVLGDLNIQDDTSGRLTYRNIRGVVRR